MAKRRGTGERSEKWSVFGSALALLTIKEVLPGVPRRPVNSRSHRTCPITHHRHRHLFSLPNKRLVVAVAVLEVAAMRGGGERELWMGRENGMAF